MYFISLILPLARFTNKNVKRSPLFKRLFRIEDGCALVVGHPMPHPGVLISHSACTTVLNRSVSQCRTNRVPVSFFGLETFVTITRYYQSKSRNTGGHYILRRKRLLNFPPDNLDISLATRPEKTDEQMNKRAETSASAWRIAEPALVLKEPGLHWSGIGRA